MRTKFTFIFLFLILANSIRILAADNKGTRNSCVIKEKRKKSQTCWSYGKIIDIRKEPNGTHVIVCDPKYYPACCIMLVEGGGYTDALYSATDDSGITIYFCTLKETVPNVFIGEECGD